MEDVLVLNYTDEKGKAQELCFSKSLLNKQYHEESLLVTKVDGQSMQPVILHEALVVSDLKQKQLEEKGIYIVFYEQRMWIKRAKQTKNGFIFESINPDFSHLVYEAKDVVVVSKVLLTFTNL